MKFLQAVEKRLGKYAIPNVMKYILTLYVIGNIISICMPAFYECYLCLDFDAIAKGQVWRLFTFILAPQYMGIDLINILFFVVSVYFYRMIGNALEATWGVVRFNLYIFSGLIFNFIAGLILYISFKQFARLDVPYLHGLDVVFETMFLAFAFLFPNVKVLYMMVIPIKVKYLGLLSGFIMVMQILYHFYCAFATNEIAVSALHIMSAIAMVVTMLNFLFFVWWANKAGRPSKAVRKRRKDFRMQQRTFSKQEGQPRHRCEVCGRTELDDPNLEFRYCSKCKGNHEYCMEHLFTHTHVK